MSIEAITDAIHEHMYNQLIESPETEDEKKIRHVDKRKLKNKEPTERTQKQDERTVTNGVHPTGPNNMNVPHEEMNK